MARSDNVLAAFVPLGAYPALPITPGAATLAETAGDATNGHQTVLVDRKTLVVAHNTGVGARTITITSVADGNLRTGDIAAYSIAAGGIAVLGPFKTVGWHHSGNLWIDVSHAEVKLTVITLPS